MKLISTYILLIILAVSCLKSNDYTAHTDEYNRLIIDGIISIDDWYKESAWDKSLINLYSIDTISVGNISKKIEKSSHKFLLVAGSWCGDTKTELPKILKIFELSKIESENIILIGVGRNKSIKSKLFHTLEIEKVPTLFILKNDKIIGKIIEFPKQSWESDIAKILEE